MTTNQNKKREREITGYYRGYQLTVDMSAPLPFSYWDDGDIVGAGATLRAAKADVDVTIAEWTKNVQ